jgi:hypothetical protein
VIFCGDLRQLEPIGNDVVKIYDEHLIEFRDYLDVYIELNGLHRFKDDRAYGEALMRLRNGEITLADIDWINERANYDKIPDNIQYATYRNKDRAAINTGLFENLCLDAGQDRETFKDCILVLSDDLQYKNGDRVYKRCHNGREQWFWKSCGEGDLKPSGFDGRMDPVLKLYYRCPLMVNANREVHNGIANGTRANAVKVHLKPGVQPAIVSLGQFRRVQVVRANQVSRLTLEHQVKDVLPRFF